MSPGCGSPYTDLEAAIRPADREQLLDGAAR
jgi:hypothetical protein